MKICIYSKVFYPSLGGIESFVFLLAREFTKLGHSITVFTDIKKRGKKKFPFKIVRSNSLLKKIKIFKKHDIVLINVFSIKILPAILLSGVKFFIIHHNHYYLDMRNFNLRVYLKKKMSIFFKNIVVSKYVKNAITGNSKVIGNMYDDKIFKRNHKKKIKDFIFCGRLVSEKGADILLDAFSLVLKKYNKSKLTIVGDGPDSNFLKRKTSTLNLLDNVEFIGNLSGKKLNNKFNEHYCTVVPSRYEAFGIVALEGLATTEFVIVSNTGGLPETINGCGQVVEPDYIKLSKAMINFIKLKKNEKKKKKIKHLNLCKSHLLNHSCEAVSQKYLDHIK